MDANTDGKLAAFARARVATLGSVSEDGQPHLVPVTFALRERLLVIAIDHKPKSTQRLKRLKNIRANGRVSVLVDKYDDRDWSRLWWVRLDGLARVVESGEQREAGIAWLSQKYSQYRDRPLDGPVILVAVNAVRGWSYSGIWDAST